MKMRTILLLCLLAAVLCLTGCGNCEHQWLDATCEAPKTCALCRSTEGTPLGHEWQEATCEIAKTCVTCGKTDGVANGHIWQDATCTEVKTCTVCAFTDGEPKGHELDPANYQQAAQCRYCDYMEGEPLKPTYEQYPVEIIHPEIGTTYDYVTSCYISGYTTVGKLTWENYRVFTSDQNHVGEDGYEWHAVTVKIVFSDRNAQKFGFIVQSALDDYYWLASEHANGYMDWFSVSYYGEVYDKCMMANSRGAVSDWVDGSCTYTAEFAWRVPVGYDAHLLLFYNAELDLQEALKNGDESLLVFRFTE